MNDVNQQVVGNNDAASDRDTTRQLRSCPDVWSLKQLSEAEKRCGVNHHR